MTDSPITKPRRIFGRFSAVLRWLIRAAMWSAILAYLFSFFGQNFLWAELLANFRAQFFVIFASSLLLSRAVGARWLLFTCLFFATAWTGWCTGQLYLPVPQPAAGETQIRVMSFNVLATNTQFAAAIDEVRKHDPDVVAVIEYANMWHVAFDALNETHPHQHREPRWHGYGIAIFSKIPLQSAETVPLTEMEIDNPSAVVELNLDGLPLRMMAVHVMSPTNRKRLEMRNRQFDEIIGHINAASTPTMLLGDMNCSASSKYLSNLVHQTGLRDSRVGFGVQPSWPDFAPLLAVPIDHVLVSQSIHVHNRFLGASGGSDHRPVVVDISLSAE